MVTRSSVVPGAALGAAAPRLAHAGRREVAHAGGREVGHVVVAHAGGREVTHAWGGEVVHRRRSEVRHAGGREVRHLVGRLRATDHGGAAVLDEVVREVDIAEVDADRGALTGRLSDGRGAVAGVHGVAPTVVVRPG